MPTLLLRPMAITSRWPCERRQDQIRRLCMFHKSLVRKSASLYVAFGCLLRWGVRRSACRKAWLLPFALSALSSSPAFAEGFSVDQKAEIQAIFKDYLLRNPEILREAMGVLQAREAAALAKEREKLVTGSERELFRPASQAVVGAPGGKITLVEFFDYNCGYCKRALSDLVRLVKEDPDLRIVLRDFPILSPDSREAAKIANAALRQFQGDKFWQFHQKLLGSRHAGKAEALAAAKELG